MAEVHDITPLHEPIGIAREMLERAPECTSGLAVLVQRNGKLWFDSAGHQRKDILWALEKMIYELMKDEDED